MDNLKDRTFWNLQPLGLMSRQDQAAFYDELADNDAEDHFFLGLGDPTSHLYENPRLEVAVLEHDGTIVPAQGYSASPLLEDAHIDVFLERYFAAAMPGNNFDLQLAISSRHHFEGRDQPERVAHTLAVKGVINDYANYLTEPVFRNLAVSDLLTLDIAVNFLSDKTTRRLLALMDNEVVSKGVQLATTFNPVYGTMASYAQGLIKMCLEAKQNVAITDAHLSFTSTLGTLSASLVEGTYLLFQPTTEEEISLREATYDFAQKSLRIAGEKVSRNHLFLRIKKSK
jgi:hypothetical protein